MILIIDVGNTFQNFYLVNDSDGSIAKETKIPTQNTSASKIEQALENWVYHSVVIACVVPSVLSLLNLVLGKKGVLIYNISDGNLILPNLSIAPALRSEIGADLLASSVSARALYNNDMVCIIDTGTATTLHIISASGEFLGASVSAGLKMSMDSLSEKTALLPKTEVKYMENLIYLETDKCMQAGMYWGYLGLLEGLIKKIKADYPLLKDILFTGGDSFLFYEKLPVKHIPNLIVQGLYIFYKANTGK